MLRSLASVLALLRKMRIPLTNKILLFWVYPSETSKTEHNLS